MKKIVGILILGLIFSCSTTKNIKKNNEKVFKKIIEASYDVKRSGEINRTDVLNQNLDRNEFYNNKGELIEYWEYETDGTIYEKTIITSDENGKPIKGITNDSKGNLKEYWITNLDNNGNIIELITLNSEKKQTVIKTSKFDESGNEIEMILKNFEYGYTNKTEFVYNNKNQLIEKKHHNGARKETEIRTYKYDKNGNNVEEFLVRSDNSEVLFKNEYDTHNNIIKNTWFENNKQTHETSLSYVYDNYGNWITRKRSSNGELGYVWERIIEYY